MSGSENSWRLEREDGIAIVTIARPERRNALDPATNFELAQLFDALAVEADLRAVILTGAGQQAFCAGYDLKDNLITGQVTLPKTGFGGLANRFDFPVPIIAAVNGLAFGGGFELALACDLIVASDNASFALPEPKVGWAALGGGVQRLPRAIGMKRAMGIILTGRTVLATEGLDLGFVNEVVPVSNLLSAARAWALQIVACAPLAVRCSKEVTYKSADIADLAGAMNIANYTTPKSVFESVDAVEGKRAFVERRPPVWKGR